MAAARLTMNQHFRNSRPVYTVAQVTIDYIEGRLQNRRWCSYHGKFESINLFSDAQKLAKYATRYCLMYTNAQKRAAATLKNTEVPLDQLHNIGETLKINITDLPELPPSSATVPRVTRSIAQPAPAAAAPATDLVVAKRTRSASPPPVRAAAKKPKRLAKSPTKPVARGKKSAAATLKESVLSANWVTEQFLGPLEDWDGDQPNQHTIERDHKGELYTSGALPVFHLEQRFYFFTALDDVCLIALPVVPSYADPLICLAGCGFRWSPRGGKGHPRNHGH